MNKINLNEVIKYDNNKLIELLWKSDINIFRLLRKSKDKIAARKNLVSYLNFKECSLYNIYSDHYDLEISLPEKNNAKECIRVMKNILRTENEKISNFSALGLLYKIAKKKINHKNISSGFLLEFIHLFKGINCTSDFFSNKSIPEFMQIEGRDAALSRSEMLDGYARKIENNYLKFKTGLDKDLIAAREKNKHTILKYFNASQKDWDNHAWQLKNVIKTYQILFELKLLSDNEKAAILKASELKIPFHITPHYLSLFDFANSRTYDAAIRALVMPSLKYCNTIDLLDNDITQVDFMDEKSTSPIKGITRRYPHIVILKPFLSCPQICVYCQRNWEIKAIKEVSYSSKIIDKAIEWIADNQNIKEVLVTGGDPLTLPDDIIGSVITKLAAINHIERIRIGTRVLVTMPQRITTAFLDLIEQLNIPGKREICIITHFIHPTELNPDTVSAIQKIRKKGISIYNQQVFTYYNSKRFETSLLRATLKLCGIDPYYTFNTKGKNETLDFRVPISRLEQERKEEGRLLSGVVRTDEPVFNLPRLGKSHLRAWQDHEIIMILKTGQRLFRFYPWESKYALIEPYNYTDVSIYDYLNRLLDDGEDLNKYASIFYYF
ncbi:MAG: KamA family radical SAM protein [Bacteroidales bacterium]|nr:KamA family radical SAM protein [Bacteroidales bacterium]